MSGNVVKMRRSRHFIFGVLFFAVVLVYLVYHLTAFITKVKPTVYTVGEESSLYRGNQKTGLIVREEDIFYAESSGYIDFYTPASGRAALSAPIYSIDEDGSFHRLNEATFSEAVGISSVSRNINEFIMSYDAAEFGSVYDLKYNLDAALIRYRTVNGSENIDMASIPTFHMYGAGAAGIVEYYTDGYECFDPENISAADFNTKDYKRQQTNRNDQVENGDPVYKIIHSEAWSIYIMLTDSDVEAFGDSNTLKIRFSDADLEATVRFEIVKGSDGGKYGKLSLTKYMVDFASGRYLRLEIESSEKIGLVIPVDAAAEEEFYVIPDMYITAGGNTSSEGLQVVTSGESGEEVSFLIPEIMYHDDGMSYIPVSELPEGTIITAPGSTSRMAVKETQTIHGVYNINKGYALFKPFKVIDQGEDYYIVESFDTGGIKPYDKILLYPDGAVSGQFIY